MMAIIIVHDAYLFRAPDVDKPGSWMAQSAGWGGYSPYILPLGG